MYLMNNLNEESEIILKNLKKFRLNHVFILNHLPGI